MQSITNNHILVSDITNGHSLLHTNEIQCKYYVYATKYKSTQQKCSLRGIGDFKNIQFACNFRFLILTSMLKIFVL